jgi:hypothetical protein
MRALCIGPSGGGKTVLLQWLILHAYKGCWARIYILSPSAILDPVWRPVKRYCERELGMDPATEPCLFDEWDAKKFGDLVMQQHRISEYQKTRLKSKTLHGVLFIGRVRRPRECDPQCDWRPRWRLMDNFVIRAWPAQRLQHHRELPIF